ncbi:MAG TPA: DoxX family membrane protein [Aldersonia sp.]
MNTARAAARALTGSTYALLGWDTVREPGGRVQVAGKTLAAMRKVLPMPRDDAFVVRANGGAQALGGALLALGIYPRMSAAILAASLVPTTLAGHGFWAVEDPAARSMQRIQFHKNLAMLGGLLFAIADAPPRRGR